MIQFPVYMMNMKGHGVKTVDLMLQGTEPFQQSFESAFWKNQFCIVKYVKLVFAMESLFV